MSSAPVLELIPDAERIVCDWLRQDARVVAIVSDRVYTAFPAQAGRAPMLLVQRIGGEPPFSIPLVLDTALLQIDAYGGTKNVAYQLAASCRAALTQLAGTVQPHGIVTGISFSSLRSQPDETYKPARPRYLIDATVHVRAANVLAARSNTRSLSASSPVQRPERGTHGS